MKSFAVTYFCKGVMPSRKAELRRRLGLVNQPLIYAGSDGAS